MRWAEIIDRPDDRVLRQFAAIVLVSAAALVIWLVWSGADRTYFWLAAAALVAGSVGIVRPRLLAPVFIAWMAIAWPIAWMVSMTALAVVFYVVLTPIALVFRLARRDALGRRLEPHRESYWEERPRAPEAARYLRQF